MDSEDGQKTVSGGELDVLVVVLVSIRDEVVVQREGRKECPIRSGLFGFEMYLRRNGTTVHPIEWMVIDQLCSNTSVSVGVLAMQGREQLLQLIRQFYSNEYRIFQNSKLFWPLRGQQNLLQETGVTEMSY